MRTSSVKFMRRSLIGLIIFILLAVMFNYIHNWQSRNPVVEETAQILDSDVTRSVDSIEYVMYRNATEQLKIMAEQGLETQQGEKLLQGVEAFDFNEDGNIRNQIRSQKAEYDERQKTVDFLGDVRIKLDQKIELRTESLHYDSDINTVTTEDRLEFYSESLRGTARGVRYRQELEAIDLNHDVNLVLLENADKPDGSGETDEIHATSDHASYVRTAQRIRLQGNARLESESFALSADGIEASLSQDGRRLTSLTCTGNAAYQAKDSSNRQNLSSDSMTFQVGERSRTLEKIDALGGAVFISKTGKAEENLRGSEIHLELDPASGLLQRIHSKGDVQFQIRRGIEETEASADDFHAEFIPGTRSLESIFLKKQARVSTRAPQASNNNELQAEEIHMGFGEIEEGAAVEKLRADGLVQWIFNAPSQKAGSRAEAGRSLTAAHLEMYYSAQGNTLESVFASGDAVLAEMPPDRSSVSDIRSLHADKIRFGFYSHDNRVKDLSAEGHAQVRYGKPAAAEEMRSSSDKLRATFNESDGSIHTVIQWGSFRYEDDLRTATAGRAEYDDKTKKLLLKESPKFSDHTSSTTGELMEYDREQGALFVHGNIRSILKPDQTEGVTAFFGPSSSSSPIVVTADEMRYWTEESRARYSSKVHLLSESSQLAAGVLEIIDGGMQVEAQDDVRHLVLAEDPSEMLRDNSADSKNPPILIRSSKLHYLRNGNSIFYTGGVTLQSDDVNLSSSSLDVLLDKEMKQIEQATARGKVLIHNGTRECEGDEADYYLDPGKFVVLGNPAIIYAPQKGRSYAGRLTFFTADDRILLEQQ